MRPTILIVDDDHDVRSALQEFVRDHGYAVAAVEDAEKGLALLPVIGRPCVVLLDYRMPGMGPDGFLAAIEALPDANEFAIVLMSASSDVHLRSDRLIAKRLKKPFELGEVLNAVEEHCGPPTP